MGGRAPDTIVFMSDGRATSRGRAIFLAVLTFVVVGHLFGIIALVVNGRQDGMRELEIGISVWIAAIVVGLWNYQRLRRPMP